MKRSYLYVFTLGLLVLSLSACVPKIVTTGWDFLGRRQVNFSAERDILMVPAQVKPLRQIMIIGRMNDIDIYGLKISFENGTDFSPNFKQRFLANRDFEIIDFPGDTRRVSSIEFHYRSVQKTARRAEVEIWGR